MPRTSRGSKNGKRFTKVGEAAAEPIDAVTAEALHPSKFVKILSPDGVLCLYYNTSTLIRIAMDKGMFMQPPHFREPMSPELQRRVEEIEGRALRFEARNVTTRGIEGEDGVSIQHRHVYFEQIMDQFYSLSPVELYVCPTCYTHWMSTRHIPHLVDSGIEVEYMEGNSDPLIDPLDVFEQMQRSVFPTPSASRNGERNGNEVGGYPRNDLGTELESGVYQSQNMDWNTPLAYMVFRRATHWKKHVRNVHNAVVATAEDYRLKGYISQYISLYNRFHEEKCRKLFGDLGGAVVSVPSLSTTRYWYIKARLNRLRYNRVVDAAERAEQHIGEFVRRSFFENEDVTNIFPSNDAGAYDDFICDSDSASDGSGYSAFPRYEGPKYPSEDEQEHVEERQKAGESANNGNKEYGRKRKAGKRDRSEEGSNSSENKDTDLAQRQQLYKRGLLAPLKDPYRTLSYEERCLLDRESRRVQKPVTIYVPTKDTYSDDENDSESESDSKRGSIERANEGSEWDSAEGDDNGNVEGIWVVTDGDVIDWNDIGGRIENADDYIRQVQIQSNVNNDVKTVSRGRSLESQVQIEDKQCCSRHDTNKSYNTATNRTDTNTPLPTPEKQQKTAKLLLDDSE